MNNANKHHGSCLCGAVQISADEFTGKLGACHCNMCRKWGGGPALAIECGTNVQIDGEQHVCAYDSSDWAQRGFCKRCGTHLFYYLKDSREYVVPIGLFDDCPDVTLESQIFIDEKPDYYTFANQTTNMTGAEVFAKYGSSS